MELRYLPNAVKAVLTISDTTTRKPSAATNPRLSKTIGIELPTAILLRADEVIE
jgi:hypothetical protein